MGEEANERVKIDTKASPAKSLALGQIVEENLFPFPTLPDDESETLRIILDSIDKFMGSKEEILREYDERAEQPEDYLRSLKELGLFGLIIPEEYGGLGLSNSAYSRVIQQLTRYDGSTALTVGAHSSIGMKGLLLFGSPEQKDRYLPRLASGEFIAAFCLTEAGAGSDAGSIKTTAVKQSDDSWLLNGEKIWITNGPIADFFTVFARTEGEGGKISAFIVEAAWEGVRTGPKEDKMGIRASATSTVSFENVSVPKECLLGVEGKGFKIAMNILNSGRTGLGGGCIGAMKRCIEGASRQAYDRKQFGKRISEFGLVQKKIAQMTVNCFAAESVVSMVGHYIDSNVEDFSIEAGISKVFSSEALWDTAYEALQIAGGNGFMKEFPYERVVRDARINTIFEGTNEILRLYIALSAMKDAGQYLKDIQQSLTRDNFFNDPIKGFGVLSDYVAKRFSQLTSLGGDRISSIHTSLQSLAAVYEQSTRRLAKATEDTLRRHKKLVIEKQFALQRIANVMIDIYVGLCVLSRGLFTD